MNDVLQRIDRKRVPRHAALIMDGNGRWAKARDLPRTEGHKAGEEALVDVVEGAVEVGLRHLTVYAFSTENWKRPPDEVRFLMNYNRELLLRRREQFMDLGVRIRFIGRRTDRRLPRKLIALAEETEEMSAHLKRLDLVIALNYGSRAELVDAVRDVGRRVHEGDLDPGRISERDIRRGFYAPDVPEVDLLVRTSGEIRVSNFMLWQAAYAELVFTEVLWPDFRRTHLWEAIAEYQRRQRRFGGVR